MEGVCGAHVDPKVMQGLNRDVLTIHAEEMLCQLHADEQPVPAFAQLSSI